MWATSTIWMEIANYIKFFRGLQQDRQRWLHLELFVSDNSLDLYGEHFNQPDLVPNFEVGHANIFKIGSEVPP